MSGHSKWSTIKRKKGALDAKRSQIFTRLVKEIQIASREGGSDIDTNPRLRLAVNNAKGANMPKDNIQRAIKKGEGGGENYESYTYEGYGPGGVAIFVECLSDNQNRTVGNIRSIFRKHGGTLGTNGSLSFIFERKGIFNIPKAGRDAEELQLELIDGGLEDFVETDDYFELTVAFEDFGNMQKKLEELRIEAQSAQLQRIPMSEQATDADTARSVLKMVEAFEDDDDVQNVFHNLEMTEEVEAIMNED